MSEDFCPVVLRAVPSEDGRASFVTFSTPDHRQATIAVTTDAIEKGFLPALMRRTIAERQTEIDMLNSGEG